MDDMIFDDNIERIKKLYTIKDINIKISNLVEYYKFHNEVPRMFI